MLKIKEQFHDLLAKLAKAIEDYYDGIKLIDLEFDNDCELIDQSIANIRKESVKLAEYHKSELSQNWKLHNKLEKIECDATKTEVLIGQLEQQVDFIDANLKKLKQEKNNLEKKTHGFLSWLIKKIYVFFNTEFQTSDERQILNLQICIDNTQTEKIKLKQTKK